MQVLIALFHNLKSLALSVLVLALSFSVEAQQPKKISQIGYLGNAGSAPESFLQGLRDLGYVEGKNVVIEFRTAGGKFERYTELAAELVRAKVDVIVVGGSGAVTAAKNATSTIPIVMASVNDPITLGLVGSLAHPGGNITGISSLSPELSGKRLELLKEVIPKVNRVAVLAYRAPAMRTSIKETEEAAQSLRLQLQLFEVKTLDEIENAFETAKKQRAEALVQIQAAFLGPHQQQIIHLAAKNRLPAVYNNRDNVEAGGLMSYGPDRGYESSCCGYRGQDPEGKEARRHPCGATEEVRADHQLKTAKQIGLTIPPNVLARADKVIK
jgi:putative ABC transport system substrate-binding protein